MTFFSLPFILFITATTIVYFIVPKRFRWCVLLTASYMFYWINSKWMLFIHFLTAAATWAMGLWIYRISDLGSRQLKDTEGTMGKEERKAFREKTKKEAKTVLWAGIIIDLGTLIFLKYRNFFAGAADPALARLGITAPDQNLLIPLGISFYTLQAISYLVDIYRGKIIPDRNPLKFMLYMSFFPQIVQGPIARHSKLAAQLYEGHPFNFERLGRGLQLMFWGWFKKLVIADRIAIAVERVIDVPGNYEGFIIFFAFALYGLQIYADFSGGIDIAAGFSQMIGISLEKNFDQPYFSHSIEEFWRRWHMTLGSWMRDYVFYPLSLSKAFTKLGKKVRKIFGTGFGKKLPSILAMFIVYFLVGIWHGSSYKYIAYGLWNGIFIMSGILFAEAYEKIRNQLGFSENSITYRIFQILRTFTIVSFGRYFSRSLSFKYAIRFFARTFNGKHGIAFLLDGTLKQLGLDTPNWILLGCTLLLLLLVDCLHERGFQTREAIARQHPVFRWLIYTAAVLAILIFGIYGPEYNAKNFIYEQF